jgi:hypothetical protein
MKHLIFIVFLAALTGCAPKHQNLDAFYTHQPRSIAVVPVVNESTEVTANNVFAATISKPLSERGYYVFPVLITDLILRDFGLTEGGHIQQLPPQQFYDIFGADSVLFITIKDWSTKYLVIHASVTVEMEYVLKDTKTGLEIWRNNQTYVHSSGGGDPIAAAISAAITALFLDYRPLAQEANRLAVLPPKGIPAGPYHPEYQQDKAKF